MSERKILESLFLFQNLKKPVDLQQLPPPERFRRGEDIFAPDDYRKALGVVLRGRVEAVSTQSDKAVLTTIGAGGVFGAAALFCDREYVSRVRAASDCSVQFLPEAILQRWFAEDAQMGLNYIGFLTDRVRFLNGRIAVYTCQGASNRLYNWLSVNCGEDGTLPKLSMTKLAATLHIGRTSLYRAWRELEEHQLLVRKDGKVYVIR